MGLLEWFTWYISAFPKCLVALASECPICPLAGTLQLPSYRTFWFQNLVWTNTFWFLPYLPDWTLPSTCVRVYFPISMPMTRTYLRFHFLQSVPSDFSLSQAQLQAEIRPWLIEKPGCVFIAQVGGKPTHAHRKEVMHPCWACLWPRSCFSHTPLYVEFYGWGDFKKLYLAPHKGREQGMEKCPQQAKLWGRQFVSDPFILLLKVSLLLQCFIFLHL